MQHKLGPLISLLALRLVLAPSASALVLPPEGIALGQIHVQFEWPAVGGASDYELWVVEDNGQPDPFAGITPVVDLLVGSGTPRLVVSAGLDFGQSYAWRARGIDGSPLAWGATHRFTIAAIPLDLPAVTATSFGGSIQPGLTLLTVRPRAGQFPGGYCMVVDETGSLVWFLHWPDFFGDTRLLDNGRLLFVAGSRANEALLNGQVAWQSPDDVSLLVHHEAFPMPSGDVLALIRYDEDVTYQSETKLWQGDRLVVFDHDDNAVTWDWNTFDHYSTLDVDQTNYDASGSSFDWTHGNAVIYNPDDDSVYFSARSLSRITRIDFSTGNIVYNMGFSMPSGETNFGDNLFSFQHAPEMQTNGNILIYDNGNRRDHLVHTPQSGTGVTKAVELAFTGNPPTGAAIVWEYTLSTFNNIVGDADRLPNGNTLVVAGPALTIHEVDATSTEVWRLEVLLAGTSFIYRAQRIDALVVDVPGDVDGDGFADYIDNCPDHYNPQQADQNGDGFGDVCAVALGFQLPNVTVPTIPALPPFALLVLAGGMMTAAVWRLRLRAS
jgi:hypothetical protein